MHLLGLGDGLVPHYLVARQIQGLQVDNEDVSFLRPEVDPLREEWQLAHTQTEKSSCFRGRETVFKYLSVVQSAVRWLTPFRQQ